MVDCEVKRHVTFAAMPIVEVMGVHNHEPVNLQTPSYTPTKTGEGDRLPLTASLPTHSTTRSTRGPARARQHAQEDETRH